MRLMTKAAASASSSFIYCPKSGGKLKLDRLTLTEVLHKLVSQVGTLCRKKCRQYGADLIFLPPSNEDISFDMLDVMYEIHFMDEGLNSAVASSSPH